jgi:hypothetical protein
MTSLKHDEFESIKLSKQRVVFIAKESLGVFMINQDPESGDAISLFANLTDQNGKVSIRLFTKFRRDWYALLGFSGLILLITALGYRTYEDIYVALVVVPIVPVWFWVIHRMQERTLLTLIKYKIKKNALQG